MTSANPTLLIGLGAFGRAVTHLVAEPSAGPAGALESIFVDDALLGAANTDAGTNAATAIDRAACVQAVTEDARARCRRLLELGYFVDSTRPTDARGPRLDIFVIGDLGDTRVARMVPDLVASLARTLRSAFRPILGAGEGALAVCPMLVAPRIDQAKNLAEPIRALARLARQPDRQLRPQARIYISEDQSGKYLLTRAELERSFAAFLSLLLMSELRDDRGVRDLVEPQDSDRVGPLATFACATLEIDTAALQELCALSLARDMLGHFDAGVLTLSEIAGEAHPLVPDRTTIESFLWKEGNEGSLEEYLQPPYITVPDIGWRDSPEDIVEQKFGPMWQLESERVITTFADEVERFKMDRLAGQIEKNGTELAAKVERELMERVHTEALASPRGPERALEFARYAATRARGLMDETRRAIDAPNLRARPESPIESGVEAIDRATQAWPRRAPFRMRFFGVLTALCGMFVIASLVHMALHMIGRPLPWWLSAAVGLAVSAPTYSYNLWRHIKQHHNWLCMARDDLDQAIQRHLHRDLVDYFRRRLEYTRALWMYRIYRRIADKLDQAVAQLEAGRAAVDEARRVLAARRHDLIQHTTRAERGGILYRSVLAPDMVDAFYEHTRPPDLAAVAARYHAEASAPAGVGVLEAPYADPDNAFLFANREFAHVSELSPYQQADSPLHRAVSISVQRFFEQLALKLSPPLEVIMTSAPDAPAPSRILIAPPEARELVDRILAAENLDRGWDIRTISGDARRIHLLIERGQLPVDALAIAAPPGSKSSPAEPGKPEPGAPEPGKPATRAPEAP